jgi:hypothetical protein
MTAEVRLADTPAAPRLPRPRRVLVLGATGTIGRATANALVRQGHEVVCFIRPRAGIGARMSAQESATMLRGAEVRVGDVGSPASLAKDAFRGERFDAIVSCLASRTGAPRDAWAIDHLAHVHVLDAARQAWACAGRPAHDLRFETFGSSGHLAPQPFGLKVPRQGIDITVAANESLLDVLELAGVSALSNCRRGECGLCALDVLALDGVIDHSRQRRFRIPELHFLHNTTIKL